MQSSDSAYIVALIAEDSGLRLLRSKNPAPAISFLFKTFRERNQQTVNAVLGYALDTNHSLTHRLNMLFYS